MHSLAALAPRFATLPLPTQALLTFALLLALALLAGAVPARSWSAWAGWTPQGRPVGRPPARPRPRAARSNLAAT